MADSPRDRRYARSPSPWEANSRSRSRSRSVPRERSRSRSVPRERSRSRSVPRERSRSRSWSAPRNRPRSRSLSRDRGMDRGRPAAAVNPGNNLYVTGLSTRVTEEELEDHFSKEGKVKSVFLVVEPRSRISRGFAFITMETLEDAERCIKNLDQSVLEGRYITVERSRRKRARTPTPGHYLGLKSTRGADGYRGGGGDRDRDRGRYRGGSSRDDYGYSRRSPPTRGGRDYSPPPPPPYRGGGRDYSPPPRRSPSGGRSRRDRSYSPRRSSDRYYAPGPR